MTFIFLSLDSLFSMMIPVASFSAHDRIGFMIAFFFKIIFTPLKNFISCFSISEKKILILRKRKWVFAEKLAYISVLNFINQVLLLN